MSVRARYAWNEGDLKIPNTYVPNLMFSGILIIVKSLVYESL